MERNVRLYPWFQASASLHFWLPIFFLYFLSVLPLHQVLLLEAIYYWAVVVLEVPSGYFSDRVGRRLTLLIASSAWTGSYLLFAFTQSFETFLLAQLLFALGMACQSGTDTSVLYDSLLAAGRADEVGDYEAKGQTFGFVAMALAALVGGLLAGVELRLAYLLAAAGSVFAFAVSWLTVEPPTRTRATEAAILPQVSTCLRRLRDPVLAWVTIFVVAMTVFNHVPYEFFQPYLELLMERYDILSSDGYALAPAAASLLVAVTMLISACGSRLAIPLRDRIGVPFTLLSTMALQGLIVICMAAFLHPLIVLLLLLRSMPRALMVPVLNATIHPRLHSDIRATFLSLQSFAGRLLFGGSLFLTSRFTGLSEALTFPVLSYILYWYAALMAGTLLVLVILCRSITRFLKMEAR